MLCNVVIPPPNRRRGETAKMTDVEIVSRIEEESGGSIISIYPLHNSLVVWFSAHGIFPETSFGRKLRGLDGLGGEDWAWIFVWSSMLS